MIFETFAVTRELLRTQRWHLALVAVDLSRLHEAATRDRADVPRWLVTKDESIAQATAIAAIEQTLGASSRA